MKKICAIVVTYNRKHSLFECIVAIQAQSCSVSDILIVDNASLDGTYEDVKLLFPDIKIIRLSENMGGSGGFANGIQFALKNLEFDWCILLDDDAYMRPDCISEIHRHILAGSHINNALVSRSIEEITEVDILEGTTEINHGMFVGFAISVELITNIGIPKEDYFIYWDDMEFSRRIYKNGGKVIQANKSLITHSDWSKRGNRSAKFLGISFEYPQIANWRMYYLIRNKFHFYRDTGESIEKPFKEAIKYLIKSFLVHPSQSAIIFRAILDGVKGKKGKTVSP